MRLITLLISVLILGLFMAFWLKRYVAPTVNQQSKADKQVEQLEKQVEDYKHQIQKQERDIYDQINQAN